jgi:hypothetical protein
MAAAKFIWLACIHVGKDLSLDCFREFRDYRQPAQAGMEPAVVLGVSHIKKLA